ncbi:universal stress protein [Paenibacillus sp. LHD-117]|uniref:universal stress protein n=1 Tax=Paenibacillus sp. LHD-117 TaxID=3071412 RepID=UPI0027DF245C|nr:universal stress protein [Paenibacillus sp. LHD-117]MDQ6419626.1 universal stress protein [Paenibacillus sp. LHD-117]
MRRNKPSNEHILVCVYYGPNGERLIMSGAKLAQSLNGSLTILTVDPPLAREYNEHKTNELAEWRRLAKQYKADFVTEASKSRRISEVIVQAAKQRGVTHIVVGHSAQSRWEEIIKGSLVNEILRELDDVDVHVVSVKRVLSDYGDEFEPGVRAHLIHSSEGLELRFGAAKGIEIEGLFFKAIGTDFDTGMFKSSDQNNPAVYKVIDGKVAKP